MKVYLDCYPCFFHQALNTSRIITVPGAILNLCSKEFLKVYDSSDLIISKGQGNYEGLSGETRPVFFLLKAKCPVVARDIGVDQGSIVLMKSV